ncbi:tetratricopeptide repeat protein [Streptomyces sp. NPDC006450]|uniref:tetratricopeptide repeat protein n=1 Tax=Streptomyces sp. NPDC006450 TaxID=3155458 RepID=UPI00339F1897
MTGNRWQQRARAEGDARITQIAVAGDYVTHAPGSGPLPPASLGLPAAPVALVGRDGAVGELTHLLGRGERGAPVTVVAGLPGVGKSALAVTTAHRAVAQGWFGDRVFFLRLHGYAPNGAVSGPQAVREMLRYLGIRDTDVPPSPDGQVTLYRARLAALAGAGQRVLIVADDAASVSQVQGLVPPDGTHRLLVTSRHRLVAPGFTARVVVLDELAAEPAAELLAGALLQTWPQDPRPAREPEALGRIAELCGRLPLALTVAGALLAGDPGLAAGELARELARARTRLETLHVGGLGDGSGGDGFGGDGFGDGEVPVGVRAAFDLSYARLPADQARIFRLLTVVPGPDCSTLCLCAVVHEGDPEELESTVAGLRRPLAALARASLLTEHPVGSGRWRMHDLIRLYALERGAEHADEDGREAAVDRFLETVVFAVEAAQQALGVAPVTAELASGLTVEPVRKWFEDERAMLVNAVGFAADSGRTRMALRLCDRLGSVLQVYRYEQDMLVVARTGLELARRSGNRGAVAMALCNLSSALLNGHYLEEAAGHLAEALALAEETGDRKAQGVVQRLLGDAYRYMDRYEDARAALEGALVIFRELGLRNEEGMTLAGLGHSLGVLGRPDESLAVLREAVDVLRETGDRHREATFSAALASALWRAGHREESLAVRKRARAVLIELGNGIAAADSLLGLGDSLFAAELPEEALTHYEEALAQYEEAGEPKYRGIALGRLGLCHHAAGRLEEALAVFREACALLAGTRDRTNEALALMGLGATLTDLGREAEAADFLGRAQEMYDSVRDTDTGTGLADDPPSR